MPFSHINLNPVEGNFKFSLLKLKKFKVYSECQFFFFYLFFPFLFRM